MGLWDVTEGAGDLSWYGGLSYLLKEYAKAVIRAQPENINAFSQAYFESKIAERKEEEHTISKEKLRHMIDELGPGKVLRSDFLAVSDEVKCPAEQVAKILEQMRPKGPIDVSEFMALACTTISMNLMESIQLMMEVDSGSTSGKVSTSRFIELVTYILLRDHTLEASSSAVSVSVSASAASVSASAGAAANIDGCGGNCASALLDELRDYTTKNSIDELSFDDFKSFPVASKLVSGQSDL
ncbi:hypothetical protein Pelo_3107 [Pelomyxa schiedti]|nr:hypothetical protein Pelo_3107 [Pelomyxa schiedti]